MAVCASSAEGVDGRSPGTAVGERPLQSPCGNCEVGKINSWVWSIEVHLGWNLAILKTQDGLDQTYQSRSSFTMTRTALYRTDNQGFPCKDCIHSLHFQWIASRSPRTLYMVSNYL